MLYFHFNQQEYNLLPQQVKSSESVSYDEVKGYMTITEAAKATKTELKEFYSKFKIPEKVPADTMMKNISKIVPEYEFDKIKEALE